MAINDEFGNISDRKVDAGGAFSSSEDAMLLAAADLSGGNDARAAIASEYAGHADMATEGVGRRTDGSGFDASRSQDSLMAELVAYTQGAGSRDDALMCFGALDRAHAERFLSTAAAHLGVAERAVFQKSFESRFNEVSTARRVVASALGDALVGSSDSVVGDAWDAGRKAEGAARTIRELGARKGSAAALLDAVLDEGDADGVLKDAAGAARQAKGLYEAGRAAGRALRGRPRAAGDVSAASAKRKSMEIAAAAREGRAVSGMGAAARMKLMAASAAAAVSDGLGAIVAALAPAGTAIGGIGMGVVGVMIALLVVLGGGSGAASSPQAMGMSDVEARVYTFFSRKGLDDVHIAAIMGNMYAESHGVPSNLQHVDGDDNACPNEDILALGESAGGKAAGLWQWDRGRRYRLASFARDTERNWYDADVQLEFFWSHDIWHRNWGSGENTKAKFMATDDLETATRIFLRGWEVAGVERIQERVDFANAYLSKISTLKGGQDLVGATEKQKRVVRSCMTTPTEGEGFCAGWVSQVFRNAGFGGVDGNADDMFHAWCTSSNRSELKVGMIVAVPKHGHTSAGKIYGHVGIYIGDGKLMDNIGPIRTIELDRWLAYYGDIATPKWGWANGNDLSRD